MDDRVGVNVEFYKGRPPRPMEININGIIRKIKHAKCIHRLYQVILDDGEEIEVLYDSEAAAWYLNS